MIVSVSEGLEVADGVETGEGDDDESPEDADDDVDDLETGGDETTDCFGRLPSFGRSAAVASSLKFAILQVFQL